MSNSDTAYIKLVGEYIKFTFRGTTVTFLVSKYMRKIIRIKEYNRGYIVMDVIYSTMKGIIEEYIDMEYIFDELQMDKEILGSVKGVVIK